MLFLQSSCDPRTCVKAVDRCPKGEDEHLSVVAENTGIYYLGIDGLDGNANVTVLSVHPVCGDGQKGIHSKVCEDSNNTDGDGCDSKCRPEIKGTGSEAEPNGDTFGANVLRFNDAPVIVKGQIGGPCDTDMYSVQIPAGGSVRAVMRNEAGAPCTADLPGRHDEDHRCTGYRASDGRSLGRERDLPHDHVWSRRDRRRVLCVLPDRKLVDDLQVPARGHADEDPVAGLQSRAESNARQAPRRENRGAQRRAESMSASQVRIALEGRERFVRSVGRRRGGGWWGGRARRGRGRRRRGRSRRPGVL